MPQISSPLYPTSFPRYSHPFPSLSFIWYHNADGFQISALPDFFDFCTHISNFLFNISTRIFNIHLKLCIFYLPNLLRCASFHLSKWCIDSDSCSGHPLILLPLTFHIQSLSKICRFSFIKVSLFSQLQL